MTLFIVAELQVAELQIKTIIICLFIYYYLSAVKKKKPP